MTPKAIYYGERFTLHTRMGDYLRRCVVVHAPLPVLRKVVGGTEYIITGRYSPTARETAAAKLRRLILNDC